LSQASAVNLSLGTGISINASATPTTAFIQGGPFYYYDTIPLAVKSNFDLGGGNYAASSGLTSDGGFFGDNLILFSDSSSKEIISSRLYSGSYSYTETRFSINSAGTLSWLNSANGNSASISLTNVGGLNRLVFDSSIYTNYGITAPTIYSNIIGTQRAMHINSSGTIGVATSSERYKENIENLTIDPQKIYNLQPVSFNYKEENVHEDSKGQKFIGLIAERLDELNLNDFVEYDEENKPDGIKYELLCLGLIETVKDLNNRLSQLENN
jgi:hypothetical protein